LANHVCATQLAQFLHNLPLSSEQKWVFDGNREARDLLQSSRKYVLPLLEWLDAQKITRRVGDDRILRT